MSLPYTHIVTCIVSTKLATSPVRTTDFDGKMSSMGVSIHLLVERSDACCIGDSDCFVIVEQMRGHRLSEISTIYRSGKINAYLYAQKPPPCYCCTYAIS